MGKNFYNIDDFGYLKYFKDHFSQIQEEYQNAQNLIPEFHAFINNENCEFPSHTLYWLEENGIYDDPRNGIWEAFPVYKNGFPVKWYDAPSTFKTLFKGFDNIPGFKSCFFFKLGPDSETFEHSHIDNNLIMHISMQDTNGPCILNCEGEDRSLAKVGDSLLFNNSKKHYTYNKGTADRISLIIDIASPL